MDGLLTGLQRLLYGSEAVDAAQQRRMQPQVSQQQFQQLLGQKPVEYTPGAGQGALMPQAGTGLLGGEMRPQEFAARMMGIPGYEQIGAGLMAQFQPKPAAPKMGQIDPSKYSPQSLQAFTQTGDYGALQPITDQSKIKRLGKDATVWYNQAGEMASPMMTMSEAHAAGFSPRSTEQIKGIQAVGGVAPLLSQSIEVGFGRPTETKAGQTVYRNSLFPSGGGGAPGRIKYAWESGQAAMGNNPRLAQFNRSTDAMLSNLARIGGQTGVLTDADVDRVKSLIPTPYVTGQGEATDAYKSIAKLLKGKGMTNEQMIKVGLPSWAINGDGAQDAVLTRSLPPIPSVTPQGGGAMLVGDNRMPQQQIRHPSEKYR